MLNTTWTETYMYVPLYFILRRYRYFWWSSYNVATEFSLCYQSCNWHRGSALSNATLRWKCRDSRLVAKKQKTKCYSSWTRLYNRGNTSSKMLPRQDECCPRLYLGKDEVECGNTASLTRGGPAARTREMGQYFQAVLYVNFADFAKAFNSVHWQTSGKCYKPMESSLTLLPLCLWWWYPVWSQGWCPAGLCLVHSAFQSCYRLDHAVNRREQGQGHQIDPILLLPGRTGLCLRFRLSVSYTPTHKSKRLPSDSVSLQSKLASTSAVKLNTTNGPVQVENEGLQTNSS